MIDVQLLKDGDVLLLRADFATPALEEVVQGVRDKLPERVNVVVIDTGVETTILRHEAADVEVRSTVHLDGRAIADAVARGATT